MFQHKDQNQNWCVIGYVNVQKMSFHIFGHFRPNSFFLVTMATNNKLRERNKANLNYKYNLCGHLNRANSKSNQRKTHISLKGFNFTFFLGQISIFVIFWP